MNCSLRDAALVEHSRDVDAESYGVYGVRGDVARAGPPVHWHWPRAHSLSDAQRWPVRKEQK